MTTPVILDVDTGIDDALALLFARRHPQLDLRAVTCVSGNADLEQVLANTLTVLDLAGGDNIPVARGAQRPLIEPRRSASHVHGSDGMADLALPESRGEAAAVVLGSGGPVTMYTPDAFETVQVPIEQATSWAASLDRVTSAVGRRISHPRAEPDGSTGSPIGLLGDAGAVCAIVAPHLVESSTHPVLVDPGPGAGRGQTHVDRRTESGGDRLHNLHEGWPVVDVIHTADAEGLLGMFSATLDSKAATP